MKKTCAAAIIFIYLLLRKGNSGSRPTPKPCLSSVFRVNKIKKTDDMKIRIQGGFYNILTKRQPMTAPKKDATSEMGMAKRRLLTFTFEK